jgi:hypothetical protein
MAHLRGAHDLTLEMRDLVGRSGGIDNTSAAIPEDVREQLVVFAVVKPSKQLGDFRRRRSGYVDHDARIRSVWRRCL